MNPLKKLSNGVIYNIVRGEPYQAGTCIWCKAEISSKKLFCGSAVDRNGKTHYESSKGKPKSVCKIDASTVMNMIKGLRNELK